MLAAAGFAHAASIGQHYGGRVLYRATKAAVSGVLVELVVAEDDGQPTDEVLGSTRADADGRFTILLTESTDKNVALVVSSVEDVADTSGDRREEGYDIKVHRTRLGFLPHPSSTKSNKILVTRRRPVGPADN